MHVIVLSMFLGTIAFAAEQTPIELQGVGIEEKLGVSLPQDLIFHDEAGHDVALETFFDHERPVILALVYYGCPNLCTFVLNGLTTALASISWTAGEKFQVVLVSIDPTEGPGLAQEKKKAYLAAYGRLKGEEGWHFLTGSAAASQALAEILGFRYRYDEDQKQYAHAAGIFFLTPEGKISRALHGIEYPVRDVKLALLEATEGKIGNVIDKLILYCYHYDPKGKKYALVATQLMKAGGAVTVVGIGLLLFVLRRKKK